MTICEVCRNDNKARDTLIIVHRACAHGANKALITELHDILTTYDHVTAIQQLITVIKRKKAELA